MYVVDLINNLLPEATKLALLLKVAGLGALGGYLSNAATEYLNEQNSDFVVNGLKSHVKFVLIGGICAVLAQLIDGSDKVLFLQALTIGATWPRIVNRFKKQNDFNKFVNSGEDVPVERRP